MSLGWGFRYFGRSFFSADGPFCSNDRINRKTEQQQQPRQSTVLCSMSPKDDVFIYIDWYPEEHGANKEQRVESGVEVSKVGTEHHPTTVHEPQ